MKDAKGHGSNRSGDSDAVQAAGRAGRAMHQSAVEDVGKLRGWVGAIKSQARRFGKDTHAYGPPITNDPELMTELTEYLHAFGV
jgi:hypothetical protein